MNPCVPRNRFFVWIALAMLVVIALGFSRSFYLRPLFLDGPLPVMQIIHGFILTLWYLLFLTQAFLITAGRRDLHRTLGMASVALAIGVFVTATQVILDRPVRHIALGSITTPEDMANVISGTVDSLVNTLPGLALFVLALVYRRTPAIHKRLMFWLFVWQIGVAFTPTRPLGEFLDPLVAPWLPFFPADLFWFAALVGYDWKTLRRIHPATWIPFVTIAAFWLLLTPQMVRTEPLRNWVQEYTQRQGAVIPAAEGSARSYDDLLHLENPHVRIYYSAGSDDRAIATARRVDNVISFYNEILHVKPSFALLILSEKDWSRHTPFPVYGMPHYDEIGNRLIVASDDNDFWKSFIPPMETLPPELARQVASAYRDSSGAVTMRGFFDLLAIHELGHAFHYTGQLTMQRKWMGELFANILLHTYIAEQEPEQLPALTVFPRMVVSSTDRKALTYTTLSDLESRYDEIGEQFPNNYGWYQSRWHMAAGTIYDEAGLTAIRNLWQALQNQKTILDDASFAAFLADKVHQSVADVPLKWDE